MNTNQSPSIKIDWGGAKRNNARDQAPRPGSRDDSFAKSGSHSEIKEFFDISDSQRHRLRSPTSSCAIRLPSAGRRGPFVEAARVFKETQVTIAVWRKIVRGNRNRRD